MNGLRDWAKVRVEDWANGKSSDGIIRNYHADDAFFK